MARAENKRKQANENQKIAAFGSSYPEMRTLQELPKAAIF